MKEFSIEELKKFNGKDGQPVYIAHQGKVYNVTESKLWKGGLHMQRHHGGGDMTTEIKAAPHGEEKLEGFPQVGILKKADTPTADIPKLLEYLINKFPFLRRHPHPMTVHFPIVFMLATPVFIILFLASGIKSFETTAMHCLAGGILFTPVAITTGLYTWWLNYMAKPTRAVVIKRRLSFLMFAVEIVLFVWRMMDPNILDTFNAAGIVYLVLILSLAPMVMIIGWFGASLTFPIEGE